MYCVECFVGCFFGPRIIVAPIVDVSAAPTDRLASLAEPPKPNEVRGDPVQSVFQCELLSHVKYELYRSRDDLREGPFLVQGAFRVQSVGLNRGPLWALFYDAGRLASREAGEAEMMAARTRTRTRAYSGGDSGAVNTAEGPSEALATGSHSGSASEHGVRNNVLAPQVPLASPSLPHLVFQHLR